MLQQPLARIGGVVRAQGKQRLPVVLTPQEVASVLAELRGRHWLVACLLYGSGLRLMETVRLRVKDLDFACRAICIRDGKGGKDRVVTLADELIEPLRQHLEVRRTTFELDKRQGHDSVSLPYVLERKYPNAHREWGWQYVFPSTRLSRDPRSEIIRRHHFNESSVQRAVKTAIRRAGIEKPASCHTLRHSFATPTCSSTAWTFARSKSS